MIPLPASWKAWLGPLLIGVIAGLQALGKLNPALSWIGTVVSILTAIELYVTTPSGAQEQMRALRAAAGKAPAVLVVAGTLLAGIVGVASLDACGQPAAVAPGASCVTSVLEDAFAGMTVAQILKKEGAHCVLDAAEVAAILLGSGDPRLVGTPAHNEARKLRGLPSLEKPPATAPAHS